MLKASDYFAKNPIQNLIVSIPLIAICLLFTLLNATSLAQPFVTVSTDDVGIKVLDSTFQVPIFLQTLNDSIAAFQITIAFDNPEAAILDMDNLINDSAEVIWNWGFSVDDFGSDGRMARILGSAFPHGEPIPPSETIHQLFMLNAFTGDFINEYHCDSIRVIYFEQMLTQFSDPIGSSLEYTYENGSYIIECPVCGDANYDRSVNVSDAVLIINYVFAGGQPPYILAAGDPNCDEACNVSDAVAIINYVFAGGYDPCDTDGDGTPDC